MSKENWHATTVEETFRRLDTTLLGLSRHQVLARLKQYGSNKIQTEKKRLLWRRLFDQFNNILIYILLSAALITSLLQHWLDTSVILGVVILNAIIGLVQEGKAEKALEALKQMLPLYANVIRSGKRDRILADELVPGDMVLLHSGDKVPADLRLVKTTNLQIQEALLTGESVPDQKHTFPVMDDTMLEKWVDNVDVYARTTPEHKLRLITALRNKNHIIAMTGDGVNDAPALRHADIGIAMGHKGTDVAREAAEIVLTDDNFVSIKHAVEEGRVVYENLKKALLFTLPNDGGEGLLIFVAILFGYTLPITPLQVLWVNMITTVTLGLALAFEPSEGHIMRQLPRNPKESLFSPFLLWRISFVSLLFVCSMFGLFIHEIKNGLDISWTRTMVVNMLVLAEVVYLINCRHIYGSVLNKEGLLGSKPVLISILLVLILQLCFTYLPLMQFFFETRPINLNQWSLILIVALSLFLIIELEKTIARHFLKIKSRK